MIQMIAKFIKILNSESKPGQISLAFCFAMIAGFTPFLSLHNIFILLLVLVLRVNLSAFILGWVVFSGISYALDPFFHLIGYKVLTIKSLHGLWTSLYNISLFRIERFYNSIVIGSLLISCILFLPVYFIFNILISKYREHILNRIKKIKIVQILKTTRLYSVYENLVD